MSFELLQSTTIIIIAVAAFLLGGFITFAGIRAREEKKALERDPRDAQIRSLEAECRVAQAEVEKLKSDIASVENVLNEVAPGVEERDKVISEQRATIEQLRQDLFSSVRKTRQLRAELADRASENVHAEARLREVETELSIVQASTDLISSGVLNYDYYDEQEDEDKTAVLGEAATF